MTPENPNQAPPKSAAPQAPGAPNIPPNPPMPSGAPPAPPAPSGPSQSPPSKKSKKGCWIGCGIVLIIFLLICILLVSLLKFVFSPQLLPFLKSNIPDSSIIPENNQPDLNQTTSEEDSELKARAEYVILQQDLYPHTFSFHVPRSSAFDISGSADFNVESDGFPVGQAAVGEPSWKTDWKVYQEDSTSGVGEWVLTFSLKGLSAGGAFSGTMTQISGGKAISLNGILLEDNGQAGAVINFPTRNYTAQERQQLNAVQEGIDKLRAMSGTTGFDEVTDEMLEATIKGETMMKSLRIIPASEAEDLGDSVEIEEGIPGSSAPGTANPNDQNGDGLPDLVPLSGPSPQ